MNSNQITSFWSKVDIQKETRSCWEWRGAKKTNGYGNVRIYKKYLLAHRVAFELANGNIPDGYIVCHICDNPCCCNPNHLMLGTIKSNAADMLIKNRQKKKEFAARGTDNGNSKLNDDAVKEIRRAYLAGLMNQYELAEKYGISQTSVGAIINRKTWGHIE